MVNKLPELSVFFPAYNEEKNIEATVTKAKRVLPSVANKWEILIINDGSKDNTKKVAQKLAQSDKRIKLIDHPKNRGYGAAFKSGLYNAKYEWVAFTDADGQFDFGEITNFIKTQMTTNADLVIGYYKKRRVQFYRKVNTKLWEFVVFLFFGLKVKDIDCGFKFINKKVINDISKLESERGAFISSEFLIKAKKKGYKIVEIGVTHYPRVEGEGTGANLDVIIKSFIDLARLWKKLR
jgi:glycosyltransferase involved in cell wall biosynthesis